MTFDVPASSSASSPDSIAAASNPPIQKSHSCVLCAQRKVKCDKAPGGCSNCTKARITCIYKAPAPPRRRKKGAREIDIHTRLRLYEDALRKLGVDPAELENEEPSKLQGRKYAGVTFSDALEVADTDKTRNGKAVEDAGVLVAGEGKSWYLENGLWTSLKGEFRDSKELLDESSDEEVFQPRDVATEEAMLANTGSVLFGSPKTANNLRPLHPRPVQIFKLWQTYLDNINPLVKVFHTPTVQQLILNASGDLDDIPSNVEALLFAIYSISLSSLSEVECDALMGESKSLVTQRFRYGAQAALVRANFLKTSDLMVLQALVLLLLSLQSFDARVQWILTGMAARIGQRIGLHRDGEVLGLPPFETEIRRRLWWQILFLDGFAEKLAGIGGNIFTGDTKRPSNLNDSSLFQGMTELPKEHEGATEMMFFLIRCHVGEFLSRAANAKSNFDGFWGKLTAPTVSRVAKEKVISDLEALFHRKYIQYCDPSVPWHVMCSYLSKGIVGMMKFMAHNHEEYASMPQSEKDTLFNTALEVTSYVNLAYSKKELQGFMWHINLHFQWKAFIFLLSELRYRTEDPRADEAWNMVELTYDFHPTFSKEESKKALPVAVGNLTLKAWDAYIAARGLPNGGEPIFIQVLQARRSTRTASSTSTRQTTPANHHQPNLVPEPESVGNTLQDLPVTTSPLDCFQWDAGFDASLDLNPAITMPSLDTNEVNWSCWDDLLTDFQMQDGNGGFTVDIPTLAFGTQ